MSNDTCCRHCEADIIRDPEGWVARDGSRTCGPRNRPQPHAPMRAGAKCPVCGELRPQLGPHGECVGAICEKTIPLSPFPPEHQVLLKCGHPKGHKGNHFAPIPGGGGHRSWA